MRPTAISPLRAVALLAAAIAVVAAVALTASRLLDGDGTAPGAAAAPATGGGASAGPPPTELTLGWRTDFTRHSVPFSEIQSGGPPKDGIPAIDAPRFVSIDETTFLDEREPVIVVERGGAVRGYPIQILVWHEIVNDELAGTPIAVTFCPLCNTAIVFDRRVGGRVLDFGTTGNLRSSDLVMYDRQTESWWQQFSGEAIVGTLTGEELEQLPARILSWRDLRREHPGAEILARPGQLGRPGDQSLNDRPYGTNPYVGYDDAASPPFFPAANADDDRLQPKERVVFLESGDEAIAIPLAALREQREIEVEIDGRTLLARWSPGVVSALDAAEIADGEDVGAASVTESGRPVAFHEPFWFAVAAFRPDTRIVR